ncbi:putative indole-3-acetic acid-amido synthetase GH3.9 [Apostichopus japonicus]|uniref:Putative indole-3-acetic acid-amido synthetase GH3.9 n=1 Tax=Stichopus japonicus TaxID=307972 RepID=A0A2G8LQ83_STIJA|nr:putative indole-3-acetic acid-amido synthetase GH3.9 [Apostichopus japonicus]
MRLMEDEWEQLVEDIREGKINSELKLAPNIRRSLEKALGKGDPKRACELQKEFEKGFDGIIRRVWPTYLTSCVPMFSHCYGATEGIIGLNMTPLQEEEEFLLTASYTIFEFIPEKDMSKPSPKTLFINELEVGQNYEVVVTVSSGLYRFRLGDVVQVAGYYQQCPTVKFLYRSGALLNLFGEKLNQAVLSEVLNDVITNVADAELIQYAAAESTLLTNENLDGRKDKQKQPYYIFFLELKFDASSSLSEDLQMIEFGKLIDSSLGHRHHYYRRLRHGNQIAKPCVHLVRRGTFAKFKEYIWKIVQQQPIKSKCLKNFVPQEC